MTTAEKTRVFVGGAIGLGILWYIWIAPIYLILKIVFTLALFWEGYTFVNKDKDDTITEGIAYLAGITQLVPLLFGTVYGYCLGASLIRDPIVASAFGLLLGHFFFSMKQKEVEITHEVIRQEGILESDRRNYRNRPIRVESEEIK